MRKIISFIVAMIFILSTGIASAMNEDRFMNSPGNQKMSGAIVYGLIDMTKAQDPGGLMVMLYSSVKYQGKDMPVMDVMFGAKTFVATGADIETDNHTYVIAKIGNISAIGGISKIDEFCNILVTKDIADMFRDMSSSKKVKFTLLGGGGRYNFNLTDKQKVQLGLIADEYDEEIAKYYEQEGSEYNPEFGILIKLATTTIAVGNK